MSARAIRMGGQEMGVSFHIAAEYRRLLAEFADSQLQVESEANGPSNSADYDPLRPLPLGQVSRLIHQLRRTCSDVPIEWRVGEFLARNSIDMVTSRALGSQNIGEALAVGHRHQHIQTNVRSFTIRPAPGGELIEVHHAARDDPDMRLVFHTLIAAKIWLLFHFYQGSGAQHKLDLRASCFGSLLNRFSRELDFVDIDFQESEVVLNLGRDLLSQQLPDMGERHRQACDQELRRRSAEVSCAMQWSDRIRAHIRASNFSETSIADVCDIFRLTKRSLGRLLREEGTSFTAILSELRRERALHLVRSTGLPLKRVAAELGFNSDASFNMAFKSWTGVPPKSFRDRGPAGSACQFVKDAELRMAS